MNDLNDTTSKSVPIDNFVEYGHAYYILNTSIYATFFFRFCCFTLLCLALIKIKFQLASTIFPTYKMGMVKKSGKLKGIGRIRSYFVTYRAYLSQLFEETLYTRRVVCFLSS